MAELQQFASGYNNAALIKPFNLLSPPLFADRPRALAQRWRGYAGVAASGLLTDKTWGKPSVSLNFGRISRAEFVYLKGLVGLCTLRCLNEDTNTGQNHNAILRQITAGDFDKQRDMYENVVATFVHLEQI